MKKTKSTFGTLATCKVRYVIAVIFTDNTLRYVSSVKYEPHKYCEWKENERAYFFDDRIYAEDICFGLNVNGTRAFVVEVPDYFPEENFVNEKVNKEE